MEPKNEGKHKDVYIMIMDEDRDRQVERRIEALCAGCKLVEAM